MSAGPGRASWLPGGVRFSRVLRALLRHRALLAGALAAAAVLSALPALAPAAAPGTAVLVAARDLPAGTVVSAGDLAVTQLPSAAVPDGALAGTERSRIAGRALASPMRRGEPLTDVRLVGPGLLAGEAGQVAAPVRVADPATGALLRPGDRVDVLATGLEGAQSVVVAGRATVLAVPDVPDDGSGALLLLAVAPSGAARLAGAAVTSRLSVVVLPTP